jgi:PIN domain nuclease of toxin-antitoxin system
MRLLLDTHVMLWWLADDLDRIGVSAADAIRHADEVFVSVASVWEVEIKRASGKLIADDDLPHALRTSSFDVLDIRIDHATVAARLPKHHNDPFDRVLIAQAQVEELTLVTADKLIPLYDVAVMHAG